MMVPKEGMYLPMQDFGKQPALINKQRQQLERKKVVQEESRSGFSSATKVMMSLTLDSSLARHSKS